MMVMQPLPVSSARVEAMPKVPLENASNSNTPMGPFQITKISDVIVKGEWVQEVSGERGARSQLGQSMRASVRECVKE